VRRSEMSESEYRQIWQDHNERQDFEHGLIDRKTTWWLSAQSLLFAAYGVSLSGVLDAEGGTFREAVAFAGLAAALLTFIGVAAVIISKHLSWRLYKKFFCNWEHLPVPLDSKPLQWGVHTTNTIFTLAPDALLPIVFICAWLYLLI
jgi:hypothetical protein